MERIMDDLKRNAESEGFPSNSFDGKVSLAGNRVILEQSEVESRSGAVV
jgi:hypothetical protein